MKAIIIDDERLARNELKKLLQEGFLMRTPRGREVTPKAYEHLGKKPYTSGGTSLLFS
jgi:Holliday junction resolvasome RuvABC ATP-dependent DNA helicase subunit